MERLWTDRHLSWDEGDRLRDAIFAPKNDELWGEGNWIRCPQCPRDSDGREVYHHVNAHL